MTTFAQKAVCPACTHGTPHSIGVLRVFHDNGLPPARNTVQKGAEQVTQPKHGDRVRLVIDGVWDDQADQPWIRRTTGHMLRVAAVNPDRIDVVDTRPLLTPRVREILALVHAGLNEQQIAARLVLSLWTVRSHTQTARKLLAVHTTTGAAAKAHDLGLLEGGEDRGVAV